MRIEVRVMVALVEERENKNKEMSQGDDMLIWMGVNIC